LIRLRTKMMSNSYPHLNPKSNTGELDRETPNPSPRWERGTGPIHEKNALLPLATRNFTPSLFLIAHSPVISYCYLEAPSSEGRGFRMYIYFT
ncbi:MAG TPA: hypothetical protein PLX97_08595, partial [Gemmatales bacterium]|nr:hypothetical protein [Gemmatales bacterium]